MTNELSVEDAIKLLKSKMDGHTDTSYEWVETVRMAIKALEKNIQLETCPITNGVCGYPIEDCCNYPNIQAVVDLANKTLEQTSYKSDARRWKRRYLDLKQRIFKLEEQTRWIPVTERLPEEDGRYLVTVQNLTGYEYLDNNVFECEFFNTDWIFKGWKDNKVIAWMPLPSSYQGE